MKGSEVQNHTKAEGEREWAHPLDLSETKDDFVVKVELPGMDAKDINISLTGDLLTIRGKKKRITTSLREVMGPFLAPLGSRRGGKRQDYGFV